MALAVGLARRRQNKAPAGSVSSRFILTEVAPMLRVITKRRGSGFRLELHGVLGGEWVPLLEQHWRAIVNGKSSARITVVLSDVEFIDSDGERLVQLMSESGVAFVASGCMNRHVIEKLQFNGQAKRGVR
jgi:anti-anti-sigma regulatory factor